ncbi:hypothetical protein K7432_009130 [Basidiobolus ranarum]|uniref:Uncharacterized protein n=1 Tax=Basidiobolus ranarum TaxID=34480 RepID=A0ABR2VXJ5_9FUNG
MTKDNINIQIDSRSLSRESEPSWNAVTQKRVGESQVISAQADVDLVKLMREAAEAKYSSGHASPLPWDIEYDE